MLPSKWVLKPFERYALLTFNSVPFTFKHTLYVSQLSIFVKTSQQNQNTKITAITNAKVSYIQAKKKCKFIQGLVCGMPI